MAAPGSLYEIFDDPDHRQLIRAYCLENLLVSRLDYDGLRTLHIDRIPPRHIVWNSLPSEQDDEIIIYGGYCDFYADSIGLDMKVWGIGLAYENLDEGMFVCLGFQRFDPHKPWYTLQQSLRCNLAYTVIRQIQ